VKEVIVVYFKTNCEGSDRDTFKRTCEVSDRSTFKRKCDGSDRGTFKTNCEVAVAHLRGIVKEMTVVYLR
jgi:hypothetical protein